MSDTLSILGAFVLVAVLVWAVIGVIERLEK